MASHAVNRFEDGRRWPIPSWLRIDDFEQALWWKRPDHVSALCEGCGKAATNLGASLRRRELELCVSDAHVRLAVNSMQEPLPQIAFKMKQKIGDGVFVVGSTVPHLLIRQLIDTAVDVVFGALHCLYRSGKEQVSYLVRFEGNIIVARG